MQNQWDAFGGSLIRLNRGIDSAHQGELTGKKVGRSHGVSPRIVTQTVRRLHWATGILVVVFCCFPTAGFGVTASQVTWNTPAAISYGTALSSTQLNASATIAGTFAYSPAAGTILGAGSQTLSVTFTPTNTASYSTVTTSVTLTVAKATPTITWATPGAIDSGTRLSSKQLDATANVAGEFAYTPAAGTLLSAGKQTLTVIFTPSNTTDYNGASASVTLAVYHGIAKLSINSSSVSFGSVELGQVATQTLNLTGAGSAPVTVTSATISGTGFSLAGLTLPMTLATGQAATLGVEFDPTVTGPASGTLTVVSTSSSTGTETVALTGTGTAASYEVNLSWDAPANSPVPVAGYNVYRSPSGSSTYQLVNLSVDGQTSYVDTTVQAGSSYNYEIESVDSAGVASAPTSPVVVTVP